MTLCLPTPRRENLAHVVFRNREGRQVAVSEVASFTEAEGAREIFRRDQRRTAQVSAYLSEGVDTPRAIAAVTETLDAAPLPPGLRAELRGEEEERIRTFGELRLAAVLALVLVLMVLAGTFESLLHPITVLAAVPLGLVGVAVALVPGGQPIGMMAMMGLIVLAGVAVTRRGAAGRHRTPVDGGRRRTSRSAGTGGRYSSAADHDDHLDHSASTAAVDPRNRRGGRAARTDGHHDHRRHPGVDPRFAARAALSLPGAGPAVGRRQDSKSHGHSMNVLTLPIRQPVAVSMFFVGIALVGAVAWQRMPVELFPALAGDQLFVDFGRPGSEPQVIEREILLPLQARVSALPHVAESWGEIRGSGGRYQVRFEPGTDLEVRELELQRIAADLQRAQPRGTFVSATSFDTSLLSSFVMMVNVLGGDAEDRNALHDLVQELVAPRFASVSGVSQALTGGGAPRQVTVTVDPDRAAALDVTTEAVTAFLGTNVGHLRFLGNLESEVGRLQVILDGRPRGLEMLGNARVESNRPVLLRHVSDLRIGPAREETLARVNGQPSVSLILFQEEGANLVRLGRELRQRVADMREELRPLGLDLVIGFDAADMVEDQIGRLAGLGATGFAIALVVLFLFFREWRAVTVVAVSVPVSLLAALSLLYLVGQSLNLITLFGLALAVGLLVDNSVVVYEAVQRRLERGADAAVAVRDGLRRTVRAIVAASATTAVVFLAAESRRVRQRHGPRADRGGGALNPRAAGGVARRGRRVGTAPGAPTGCASGSAAAPSGPAAPGGTGRSGRTRPGPDVFRPRRRPRLASTPSLDRWHGRSGGGDCGHRIPLGRRELGGDSGSTRSRHRPTRRPLCGRTGLARSVK